MSRTGRHLRPHYLAAVLLVLLAACGSSNGAAGPVRLYTSVTQETVDAVLEGFRALNPDTDVDVFRAPTGELTARIAAEQREGGLGADVFWLTDPLSMQQYSADGLLGAWEPAGAAAVPAAYREASFWGTRILNMVIIRGADVPPPGSWLDLTGADYRDGVAIPDPGFAGSAFGALGYFALADGYGLDFYRALKDNGAVQVASPGDVVTGVAEGRFAAGMTLDTSARAAIDKGSPIDLVWPEPGAIAVYSPIALIDGTDNQAAAEALVEYVLSVEGQQIIASTGWEPVRTDVEWSSRGPAVAPDWAAAFDRQAELLDGYRAIFGG